MANEIHKNWKIRSRIDPKDGKPRFHGDGMVGTGNEYYQFGAQIGPRAAKSIEELKARIDSEPNAENSAAEEGA